MLKDVEKTIMEINQTEKVISYLKFEESWLKSCLFMKYFIYLFIYSFIYFAEIWH